MPVSRYCRPRLMRPYFRIFRSLWLAGIVAVVIASAMMTEFVNAASAPSADKEIMTLEEAACFLRVNPQTVEQLAKQQGVPARRIGVEWRFSRTALLHWLAGVRPPPAGTITDLSMAQTGAPAEPLPGTVLSQVTGRDTVTSASDESAENKPHSVGEKPDQKTAEEVFLRDQGVLLKARQVTLELDIFYSKSEQDRLFVGHTEQNTFTSNYSARYGLWNDLQFSASVPLHHQINIDEESTETSDRWGDVSFALRQAVLAEGVGYPNVILSLEGQAPTNQHRAYGAGGGIALTKSIDPAVLFGNFSYLHAFSTESENLNELQAKHTFSGSLGIAYALNDTLMLSTAISGLFSPRTTFASATLPSMERYTLQFGLTSLLTERLYIEPTVSFGLNGTSSDVAFGISIPYTF